MGDEPCYQDDLRFDDADSGAAYCDGEPCYKDKSTFGDEVGARYSNHECKGCVYTVDMSCPYASWPRAFYHRIADCFLPSYGLLEMAREVAGTVCVLTYPEMKTLLTPLLAGKVHFRFIPD